MTTDDPASMPSDGANPQDWQRLGERLLRRRMELGWTRRSAFAKHLGMTHDRTLADLENARRNNFEPGTLVFIEQGYAWEPGSIAAVLAGGEPTRSERPAVPAHPVGPVDEGREPYLTRREGPDLSTATIDELLEEVARRARAANPDAQR